MGLTIEELEARNAAMLERYDMVERIAKKVARTCGVAAGLEVDDLVSAGMIGLAEAWERFDDSRGVPFDAYAAVRIRGSIIDSMRSADWVPRSVRASHRTGEGQIVTLVSVDGASDSDRSAAERYTDSTAPEPGLEIEEVETRTDLLGAVEQLPDLDRLILALTFFEGLKLAKIAAIFGVSESRISQRRSSALRKARGLAEAS